MNHQNIIVVFTNHTSGGPYIRWKYICDAYRYFASELNEAQKLFTRILCPMDIIIVSLGKKSVSIELCKHNRKVVMSLSRSMIYAVKLINYLSKLSRLKALDIVMIFDDVMLMPLIIYTLLISRLGRTIKVYMYYHGILPLEIKYNLTFSTASQRDIRALLHSLLIKVFAKSLIIVSKLFRNLKHIAPDRRLYSMLKKASLNNVILFNDNFIYDPHQFSTKHSSYSSNEIDEHMLKLMFSGHISLWDGADKVVDVVKSIERVLKNILRDYRIKTIFVGPIIDDNVFKHLRIALGSNAEFLGRVPHNEIHKVYSRADIAILTRREPQCGIGLEALELLALGVPIIVENVGEYGTLCKEVNKLCILHAINCCYIIKNGMNLNETIAPFIYGVLDAKKEGKYRHIISNIMKKLCKRSLLKLLLLLNL